MAEGNITCIQVLQMQFRAVALSQNFKHVIKDTLTELIKCISNLDIFMLEGRIKTEKY